jgi:hypothetical protein
MAYSRSDMNVLQTDAGFVGRVRASMIAQSIAITNEGWTVAFHRERDSYAVQVLNSPDTFKQLFANAAATAPNVVTDATQGGTVVLASSNVAVQAALVTDADIDGAVTSQFNSFFRTPA